MPRFKLLRPSLVSVHDCEDLDVPVHVLRDHVGISASAIPRLGEIAPAAAAEAVVWAALARQTFRTNAHRVS